MGKEETKVGWYQKITYFLFGDGNESSASKVIYLGRLALLTVKSFFDDLCLQRAASLSYTTILAFFPASALMVLYFKIVGKLDDFSESIQHLILDVFVAKAAQDISGFLDKLVANIHTRTLGLLGTIGLIVTAYMVFRTIEKTMNDIWKIRKHRRILARLQILSTFLILLPLFLMMISLYISGKFQQLSFLGHARNLPVHGKNYFGIVYFMLTLVTFFTLFKAIPNTLVRIFPAFLSAVFSAVVFEFAKMGFNLYVSQIGVLSNVYGVLGLIPILLIWIYVGWIIVLFGVEFTCAIQNFDALYEQVRKQLRLDPLDIPLHEDWGKRVVDSVISRFDSGYGPASALVLAKDLGLRESHVNDHLQVLIDAGILGETDKEGETLYLLLKPKEQISKEEIHRAFRQKLGLEP